MISFSAVGDIMLARVVGEKIKLHGPLYPFDSIIGKLHEADILFGNLETPLSYRGTPCKIKDPHITFRADPMVIEGLKTSGFKVLSIANNHILDYGEEALHDTMTSLSQYGIVCVGTHNINSVPTQNIVYTGGIKVGFLAYNSLPLPKRFSSAKSPISINPLHMAKVRKDIIDSKRIIKPDILVISVHWGLDYYAYPIPFQMSYAREMIDCGAHIILGHHPHVIQGVEKYKKGIIVYSLGDFIFDEPFPATKQSFIFSCKLSLNGIDNIQFHPVIINDNYQPVLAKGNNKTEILERIRNLSEEYKNKDWKYDHSKNPTSSFFILSIRSGMANGNLLDFLPVFPKYFLVLSSLPIILSKILIKVKTLFAHYLEKRGKLLFRKIKAR